MNKIKTNEVYVINQPKHSIMTFIFIDPKLELMETCHSLILKLAENSDIMFIFKSIRGIDPDAFSKVYGACSWIVSDKIVAKTFVKAFAYSIAVFKDFVGFLTFDNYSTNSIKYCMSDSDIERLVQVAGSGITRPIFSASHLNVEEMYDIYRTDNIPEPILPWKKRPDVRREYTTWKMTSESAFFRPSLFEKLNTLSEDYIDSFTWESIRYFIASACEYLGIKRLNYSVFDLNINRLSDYVDAEGKK